MMVTIIMQQTLPLWHCQSMLPVFWLLSRLKNWQFSLSWISESGTNGTRILKRGSREGIVKLRISKVVKVISAIANWLFSNWPHNWVIIGVHRLIMSQQFWIGLAHSLAPSLFNKFALGKTIKKFVLGENPGHVNDLYRPWLLRVFGSLSQAIYTSDLLAYKA